MKSTQDAATPPAVALELLGPIKLSHQGQEASLPRSKKCRALLSYLAVTDRPHRRDRLCDLFWDVADDPRGGLRWTLSRLRSVLPKGAMPIDADRKTISFRSGAAAVDARALSRLRGARLSDLSTPDLEATALLYRGEFLEGLELPDFLEFTAWCVAHREEYRRTQCSVLHELVGRWPEDPRRALPWARKLVHVDAFGSRAHETLLRLLLVTGAVDEAELRYEHAARQFREVGAPELEALKHGWLSLRANVDAAQVSPAPTGVPPRPEPEPIRGAPGPFVGRQRPLRQIRDLIDSAQLSRSTHAVLVTAEPGGGKTRFLEHVGFDAVNAGFTVLVARAFDLERGRPFGPWLDALEVASDELVEPAQTGGRTRIFDRFKALVRERGDGKTGVVLVLDDVQWLDPDSADALQHLIQSYDGGSLIALLGARGGELSDNAAMTRLVRSLRRDKALKEIKLDPLSAAEVMELISAEPEDGPNPIVEAAAGNPLYALELARGAREGHVGAPSTLVELMRERVGRISDAALDVLRWGAVLGYAFDAARLESLSEFSRLELVDALEELERHALLRIDVTRNDDRFVFSHDIVREVVYGELSHPRKRLMHHKTAHLLREGSADPATAYEVARHASLAGDRQLGVSACCEAGLYALRTCANGDAEALARRGLHHAADLDERLRVASTLELLHVLYSARAPDRAEATERVRALAERALDLGLTKPARIGFQMLSYLRWESSSMADAHANILQAERVSRSADPAERTQALAYAARCLVLLERNLGQAEAFVMEAIGLSQRVGRSTAAVSFAQAMIAAHRGDTEAARTGFIEAQDLARASGERLAEFAAIEHRLMLALHGDVDADALALAEALEDLGARVRPGAEVASARALHALAREMIGAAEVGEFDAAVSALREADAKYELSFVLTHRAVLARDQGEFDEASSFAASALDVAKALGRVSDVVMATAVLADCAHRSGDLDSYSAYLESLEGTVESDFSAAARTQLQQVRLLDQ